MFFHNITRHLYVDVAMGAGLGRGRRHAQNGIVIDTSTWESIVFVAYLGTTGGGFTGATIQVQYGNASNGSDMANVPVPANPETYNITPTSYVTVPSGGASLGYLSVELHRPTKRYARIVITPAGGTLTINGAFVLMGKGGFEPPAQGASMGNVTPQVFVSP